MEESRASGGLFLLLYGISAVVTNATPPIQGMIARTCSTRARTKSSISMLLYRPTTCAPAFSGSEKIVGRAEELRSEEHTSELQSLMRISYAVFCLTKKQ